VLKDRTRIVTCSTRCSITSYMKRQKNQKQWSCLPNCSVLAYSLRFLSFRHPGIFHLGFLHLLLLHAYHRLIYIPRHHLSSQSSLASTYTFHCTYSSFRYRRIYHGLQLQQSNKSCLGTQCDYHLKPSEAVPPHSSGAPSDRGPINCQIKRALHCSPSLAYLGAPSFLKPSSIIRLPVGERQY